MRLYGQGRAFALVALLLGSPLARTPAEYELKAACLYRFANFVSWPHEHDARPFCIGVIGLDPFGTDLDHAVRDQTINGRAFRIRRFRTPQDVESCEIVFISSSERDRLLPILERLKGTPTLTVSDLPEFCEYGGMIGLSLSGDRIHLQLNLESAERSNLQLSSKLLNLASVFRASGGMDSQ